MFVCQAYYGGQARCAEQAVLSDDYKPAELVCAGCSHSAGKVSNFKIMWEAPSGVVGVARGD